MSTVTTVTRSRWYMPAFCLFLGALMLGAFWIGGDPEGGIAPFAIMAALGAVFLFGSRSETLQGLGGPGRDERWAMIDMRATNFAGLAVITAVIAAWLYELAQGNDGSQYAWLGVVGGAAYVISVLWLRRSS